MKIQYFIINCKQINRHGIESDAISIFVGSFQAWLMGKPREDWKHCDTFQQAKPHSKNRRTHDFYFRQQRICTRLRIILTQEK